MSIFDEILQSVLELKSQETLDLVEQALDEGRDPVRILNEGVVPGVRQAGVKFENQEYFLPELMMVADLAEQCTALIKPHLSRDEKGQATVLIATVQGDLHDLGKNLVALLLEMSGFAVIDLGVDVPTMDILDKAEANDVDVIALSALMATTLPVQQEVLSYLRDAGVRERYQVIIGGAPTTDDWAQAIGADGWAEDAPGAVRLVENLTSSQGGAD
jgi:5-methyltetrahydrofolate--homocysteine methyltransferase